MRLSGIGLSYYCQTNVLTWIWSNPIHSYNPKTWPNQLQNDYGPGLLTSAIIVCYVIPLCRAVMKSVMHGQRHGNMIWLALRQDALFTFTFTFIHQEWQYTDTDTLLNSMQQTCTKIMQWKLIQCNDRNTRLHKRTKERKLQCKKAPIDKWMLKSIIIALGSVQLQCLFLSL